MDKKNLAQVSILLTTFLLALPVTPTMAAPMANVCLSPTAPNVLPGQSFSVSVSVANANNLEAMDLQVSYDPNILQITSTGDSLVSGTLFDPTTVPEIFAFGGPVILNSVGLVRIVVSTLGGVTVGPNGALMNINFQVNNPLLGTASELPSAITIFNGPDLLVGYTPSTGAFTMPHTVCGGAVYAPGNVMGLRSVQCRETIQGWSLTQHGFTPTMFCRIINNGPVSEQGGAVFNWKSLNGITGSATGSVSTLTPGQNGESDASISLPSSTSANDIFIITGTALTSFSFPDGTSFAALGPSNTFKLIINP